MVKNRDELIDVAKGIAIFLVVWGHIIQYTLAPTGADFFQYPLFEIIYSFHMPLFMFVSGYLTTYSIERGSLKENLVNKINGILIPYVLWSFIITLVMTFIGFLKNGTISFMGTLKLAASNLIVYPYVWFLYVLFIFYCALYLTIYLEKKIGKKAFALITTLILVIPVKAYFGIYYIQFFYLFFLVGYLVSRYKITDDLKQMNMTKKVTLFVSLLIAYIGLMSLWNKTDYIYINLMTIDINQNLLIEIIRIVYRYVVAFVGIVLVIFLSNYIKNHKVSKCFKVLGNHSLDIYLIQNVIVSIIYKEIVEKYNLYTFLNEVSFVLYSFMAAILGALLCVWISETFIKKSGFLNRWLLGGRKQKNFRKPLAN